MADKIDMFHYYQSRMIAQAREQQQAALFNIAFGAQPGQVAGTAAYQIQASQAMPQGFGSGFGLGLRIGGTMSQPGMSHLGTVREFRRKFKEYTKAEFREMGSRPVIKEILSGMTKLNKEEIKDRIVEHLALV